MSLKQKAISGLKWSFIDNLVNQGFQFIVGIILARLLSPKEFGFIGMLTFFIAVSQSLIDSGFGQALIRKKNCSNEDYSTVFYFNIAIGTLLYLILFISSGFLSKFYREPQLFGLIRILGLVLIINSFSILQRTILTKNVNFKLQTRISLIASFFSGAVGIVAAYAGYGVWALVYKTLSHQILSSLLLWTWNRWIPLWTFKLEAFKDMFSFGSKLMLSGLINTIYNNIYYLIIGKFFSSVELGFFTRANNFCNLPTSSLTSIVQRVSYPVLASMQEEQQRLKAAYKKLIKGSVFFTFSSMMLLAAIAKPLILFLIGEKWLPSVTYLRLLCFASMLYPLHALNIDMISVRGRSDLLIKLEIVKKTLSIPIILVGILTNMKILLIGMVSFSFIGYYINCYWSSKVLNYSVKEQIFDVAPSFIFALFLGICVFVPTIFYELTPGKMLGLQFFIAVVYFYIFINLFKINAYTEIKQILIEIFRTSFK